MPRETIVGPEIFILVQASFDISYATVLISIFVKAESHVICKS